MGNPLEFVSDVDKTFAFLAKILKDQHDLRAALEDDKITVDEWTQPNSAGTIFSVNKAFYQPIVVEYILAVYPQDSTFAQIQLGDRIIPVPLIAQPAINQIPLGATGVATYSNNSVGVTQTISGGTVTAIAINGTPTGLTSGAFYVPPGGTVTVTYSVAPTTFVTSALSTAETTLGVFTADVRMQLEWDDIRTLTIAPAGAGYLEIMGYMSKKEIDRR